MLTRETPQPTLQHQPTRHSGTVTTCATLIATFTSTQHTLHSAHVSPVCQSCVHVSQCVSIEDTCHLSNVSACACQRGQPTVAGEEQLQQASTRRPDTRVPGHVVWLRRHVARVAAPRPGHRQLSTRQTAADLWLRTGMAPLIRLSVSCSTVRRSRGGTRSLLSFYSPAWDLLD